MVAPVGARSRWVRRAVMVIIEAGREVGEGGGNAGRMKVRDAHEVVEGRGRGEQRGARWAEHDEGGGGEAREGEQRRGQLVHEESQVAQAGEGGGKLGKGQRKQCANCRGEGTQSGQGG
ncbi:unnamed protein product [Closterium sp. NIES-64]|nr:unnamed protein product [Closterium sp. NIES-64]